MSAGEITVTPSAAAGRPSNQRLARAVGWTAFAAGTVLRGLALGLALKMGAGSVRFDLGIGPASFIASDIVGTASGVVGAIIVARRPANAVGWLYVVAGAMQSVLTCGLAAYAVTAPQDPATPTVAFAWLSGIVDYSVPFSFAALVLALFPDGRVVGPRWRSVVALAVVGQIIRTLEVAFGEARLPLVTGAANPYRLSGLSGDVLRASSTFDIGSVLVESALALAALSLALRYRRASLDGRRQIRWILLAGFVALVGALPLTLVLFLPGVISPSVDVIGILFLALTAAPIATLIAITRYRLYEIDRIVNRALLYGSLTAILAGVFTAGIGLAQRVFVGVTGVSSDWAIVLTTLVVATLYAPLRKRLEAIVDRRFKYERFRFGAYEHDLADLLSLVDPSLAAQRLIRETVTELRAGGGAVIAKDGSVTANAGTWPAEVIARVPIPHGTERLSTVVLSRRSDGSAYRAEDLEELARVAGLAARATRARRTTA
jgi:hypothetical protein